MKNLLQCALLLTCFITASVQAAKPDELGCISGDCENGIGTLVQETADGLTRYRGAFITGKYHGYGKLELVNTKTIYKGNFVYGKRQGRGTQWDRENNVYIGTWRNDKRNGEGVQAYRVEGWAEDKYTETGLVKIAKEYYQGSFLNDNFEGQGGYHWPDGVSYTGGWAVNKKHGAGYFLYPTGVRSDRVFKFDERVYEIPPDL